MARANLQVDHELAESFRNAQNADSDVRCMKVVIQGESLILEETLAKIADSGTDFNSMLSRSVQSANACMLLYNLSDESESVFNSGSLNLGSKAKEWCLIYYKALFRTHSTENHTYFLYIYVGVSNKSV